MACVHLLVLRFVVLKALALLKNGSEWPFVWRSRIAIPAFWNEQANRSLQSEVVIDAAAHLCGSSFVASPNWIGW
jgi:hypothetical protein